MSEEKPIPPWAIFLGFMVVVSPVGIILALVLWPYAIPVLLAFFGTSAVWFCIHRLGTNLFTKVVAPDEYEQLRVNDHDPFYASLGFGGTHPKKRDDQSND